MDILISLVASLGLAVIHLAAGKLHTFGADRRSVWLSFAGGVSISYVLLHLLPELAGHRERLAESLSDQAASLVGENGFYALTLLGLVVFYGLEKFALRSNTAKNSAHAVEPSSGAFWVHIGSFAAYNALVGYVLVTEDRAIKGLAFYFVALGLHFLVNDFGLARHHREQYRRTGRWIISLAIIAGSIFGMTAAVPEALTAAVIGFLAGAILLNTFKEELPEERESCYWALVLGASLYAGLLLAL